MANTQYRKGYIKIKKEIEKLTLFKNRQPVNSVIELPGKHNGIPYLTGGLRRVYSSGSWSEKFRQWSKRHGSHDENGSYLTCVRPYLNGKQREFHVDMSKADIDLSDIGDRSLQWEPGISTNPLNSKFMRVKYKGTHLTRKDLAEMIPSKLESFIEGLGMKRTNPRKYRKRILGPIPKKSVTLLETK